jgi:hypothetical protein
MPDTGYAAFVEDCRRQRASLIGLIEAIENKMLGAGVPIVIPESMNALTQALLASMQHTLAVLKRLIAQYETDPAFKE